MNIFDKIIGYVTMAAEIGAMFPGVPAVAAAIVAKLLAIVSAINAAHIRITGKPIDYANIPEFGVDLPMPDMPAATLLNNPTSVTPVT